MLDTIWQMLVNTPWWVYVIFVVVMKIGIQASRPHTVPFYKLFIVPVIFTAIAVHTLIDTVPINLFNVSTLIAALLLGAIAGWWQMHSFKLKVDRSKWLIEMPGTWSILAIILVIFVSKYYFSYELAVEPQIIAKPSFVISLLGVTGVCAGLFIGRLLYCCYRFCKSYKKV